MKIKVILLNNQVAKLFLLSCLALLLPVTAFGATSAYFPHASDGRVSTAPYPGSWSTQHAATTGAVLVDADPTIQVTSQASHTYSGYLSIQRGFFSFDTSNIPGLAKIVSAALKIYPTAVHDNFNDSYSSMNIYEGKQSSPTSLTLNDIDNCGDSLTNPTPGSTDTDLTSVTINQYLPFSLNTSGLGWISTTGYSKFCIREKHDAVNSEPVNHTGVWKTSGLFYTNSEYSGTSQDPYLEVTYSLPPLPPEQLYTEATTTPLQVTDTTPEFSAIFRAPESTDAAANYQIQVSASSTAWTSLLWDSGKTAMATTTAGSRIADVSYSGTSLTLDDSTYFWRIRMWNTNGVEGYWSGPHYFVMD